MGKILYYCGSFDPITKNHMEIYDYLTKLENVDAVYFSVDSTVVDGHKPDKTSLKTRLDFISQAYPDAKYVPAIIGNTDNKTSYEYIKSAQKLAPTQEMCLVFGLDNLPKFVNEWTDGKKLLTEHKVYFVATGDTVQDDYYIYSCNQDVKTFPNVEILHIPDRKYNHISSTSVRNLCILYVISKRIYRKPIDVCVLNTHFLIKKSLKECLPGQLLLDEVLIHTYCPEYKYTTLGEVLEKLSQMRTYVGSKESPDTAAILVMSDVYYVDTIVKKVYDKMSSNKGYIVNPTVYEKEKGSLDVPHIGGVPYFSGLPENVENTNTEFQVSTKIINDRPYHYLEEADMVAGIVYNSENKTIYLTKQARPCSPESIEPAGGKIEPRESPMIAIVREIQEELQMDLTEATITYISKVNCAPGLFTARTYLYWIYITETKLIESRQDEGENVSTYAIPLEEFKHMFKSGKFEDVRIHAILSDYTVRTILHLDD